MDPRSLPVKTFNASGVATTTDTFLNRTTTYVTSMTFSNIDSSNHTITLKDGNGVNRASIAIASQDIYPRTFTDGWDFTNGIQIACDANSVVNYEFFGYQNYL